MKKYKYKYKYKYKIYNLVLSGGAFLGLSFIGAYKYLKKKKLLNNIKSYSGCSFGSIIAFLINIDIEYNILIDFLMEFKLDDICDINKFDLLLNYGFESGDLIIDKIIEIIKIKNISPDITFKQLYELTNKKLYINTICLNNYEVIYNSIDNIPDMKILLAIRMSISIPIIFNPVIYENKYYIDGGLIDNIPIEPFKEDMSNTLIIKLSFFKKNNDINNFNDYLITILKCIFYNSVKNINIENNYKNYNIIDINTNELTNINFDFSNNNKKKIFNYGFKCTKNYYLNVYCNKFIDVDGDENRDENGNEDGNGDGDGNRDGNHNENIDENRDKNRDENGNEDGIHNENIDLNHNENIDLNHNENIDLNHNENKI